MSGLLLSAWLVLAASAAPAGAVLVVPPEESDGSGAGWVGALISDLLPRALDRAGVPAVAAADRRRAQEALGVSAAGNTRATSIRVAESLGCSRLVVGSWRQVGADLTLSLRLLDASRGSLSAPFVGTTPGPGLPRLVRSLAWDLALAGPHQPRGDRRRFVDDDRDPPEPALRCLGEGLASHARAGRLVLLRQAVALAPDWDEAILALGRALIESSSFGEARDLLARVAPASALSREARFLEGVCLLGLGRHREADILYAGLAQERPSAAVLANRAIARLRSAGAARGASVLLRQALDLEPAALDVPFDLGLALLVEGDPPAAAFWLRGALRRDPTDAQGRLLYSWALHIAGQTGEAEEQWQAAAALDPALGDRRFPDLRRRLERVAPSERGVLIDPERRVDAEEARSRTARAERLLASDPTAAQAELSRAVLLDPYFPAAHLLLARIHEERQGGEQAVEALRMALWCREDPGVRRRLAELLVRLGREQEADRIAKP